MQALQWSFVCLFCQIDSARWWLSSWTKRVVHSVAAVPVSVPRTFLSTPPFPVLFSRAALPIRLSPFSACWTALLRSSSAEIQNVYKIMQRRLIIQNLDFQNNILIFIVVFFNQNQVNVYHVYLIVIIKQIYVYMLINYVVFVHQYILLEIFENVNND